MSGDPNIGRLIDGRFEVIELIGEGGFGAVYRAEQRLGTHQRAIALKLGKPDKNTDSATVSRFLREARALDTLQSRHVCRVYGAGYLDDGSVFIAMEFVDGPTLRQLIKQQAPLDPVRVARFSSQILEVLAEAQGLPEPILHRDLKPANLMVRRAAGGREHVFVLDFGIAKVMHVEGNEDTYATVQGMMVGSPAYTAPERLKGEEGARADLYSLGVIMFELLTGKNPFKRKIATASLLAHAQEPVPDDMARLGVPAGMQAIVLRALEKDPTHRWADAEEMLAAVRDWQNLPVGSDTDEFAVVGVPEAIAEASQPTDTAHLRGVIEAQAEPAAGRRRAWALIVVAALLLGGASLWWASRSGSPTATTRPPKAPQTAASATPRTIEVDISQPATVAPMSAVPTTVAPTTVAPASVAPASVAPASVAPASVAPASVAPASAPRSVAPQTRSGRSKAPTRRPKVLRRKRPRRAPRVDATPATQPPAPATQAPRPKVEFPE